VGNTTSSLKLHYCGSQWHDRPHPGPLPQERVKHVRLLGRNERFGWGVNSAIANPKWYKANKMGAKEDGFFNHRWTQIHTDWDKKKTGNFNHRWTQRGWCRNHGELSRENTKGEIDRIRQKLEQEQTELTELGMGI
jgi:hypothetical protein